jgi:hypothetical protein
MEREEPAAEPTSVAALPEKEEVRRRPTRWFSNVAKGTLLVLIWLTALSYCAANTAAGSALDCEGIKDVDMRHYCRAVAIPRKSECEFIKNKDLRYECRARVR